MSDVEKKGTQGESLGTKTVRATKWSLVTQVASKLISPITTLVLAHLMAPEVFGVVALVTMVTSFADLFSDAGFQKYLIQHEYENEGRYRLSANVAFWTNLGVSLFLWGLIVVFREELATLVGDPTIGLAIAVACASLPLTALVSVQTAVYQRRFDFRALFFSKVGSSLVILLVSVPLALLGMGYWSMIAGTIASNLLLAVWLTVRSNWKPGLQYSLSELREMLSFSVWTLVEALSIWATSWAGAFVLGSMMDTYHLGLYNTSVSLANAVVGIVTGAVNPVIFASLSRLQGDRVKFDDAYYRMQKYLGFAVVPVAAALFVFSDAVVGLYLGDAWVETATFFGLYSLASAFVIVFSHISSNAYRALGRPRWSLLGQLAFLCFLVPSLVVGALGGWEFFSVVVPAMRLIGSLVVNLTICRFLMGLSPFRMVSNLRWVYAATAAVSLPCYAAIRVLGIGYAGQCALAVAYFAVFFILTLLIKDLRQVMFELLERFGFMRAFRRVLPGFLVRRWGL